MAPSGSPENVRAEGRRVTRPEGQGEVVIGRGEKTGEGEREKEGERRQGEGEQRWRKGWDSLEHTLQGESGTK